MAQRYMPLATGPGRRNGGWEGGAGPCEAPNLAVATFAKEVGTHCTKIGQIM